MVAKAIRDEFSRLENRSERYRSRHIKAGLCIHCPKPRTTALHCRECADKHNLVVRKTSSKTV